jgi:hypothetical protein
MFSIDHFLFGGNATVLVQTDPLPTVSICLKHSDEFGMVY